MPDLVFGICQTLRQARGLVVFIVKKGVGRDDEKWKRVVMFGRGTPFNASASTFHAGLPAHTSGVLRFPLGLGHVRQIDVQSVAVSFLQKLL